jgi:hypothetical protein
MTLKLAGWQLVAVGLIVGILGAGGVALALSGGSDKPAAQAVVQPTSEPTRFIDAAPTSVPPTSTPLPPTQPPPPPPPTEIPVRTDCAAIRATGYNSDAERNYFLANCTGGNAPAPTARPGGAAPPPPPAPAAAPSGPQALTAEEQHYKDQASAQLAYLNAQVAQFANGNAASFGSGSAAILQFCTLVGNVIPALDNLQPVPPRYKAVHDAMRSTHVKLHADCILFNSGMTSAQIVAWYNKIVVDIDAADGAIDDYSRVVGIKLQDLSN